MTQILPRIPICPVAQTDECLSSWIERTACFYGCDLDRWIGQFSIEFTTHSELPMDFDLSDKVRAVVSEWSAIPLPKLPILSDTTRVLPNNARLAFCEQCWDEDARSGRQPYIRRYWLNWTTVHCVSHRGFLCAKNRSVDANAPHVSWTDVWASKPNWRNALQLQMRGTYAGTLWYRMPSRFCQCTERLLRLLERLADPSDELANEALDRVCGIWRSSEQLPVVVLPHLILLPDASPSMLPTCHQ